jgi:hypothetical protein
MTVSSIVVSLVRPRDDLARARDLEPGRRQREQMVEHRAAQVRGDALAEPRDVVEARVGRDRHHHDDDERPRERSVELAGHAGAEAAVDDDLDALPQCERRAGGDDQRDDRDDEPAPVRSDEAADARKHAHRRRGRKLGGVERDPVTAGHRVE